jgi:ribosome-interacting GTPase 1
MTTIQQKIAEVEAEMDRTQKNKATNTHLGVLKSKLAKLKRELIDGASKGGGGSMDGFEVGKTGDSRIGLVGFPSVGNHFFPLPISQPQKFSFKNQKLKFRFREVDLADKNDWYRVPSVRV